MSTNNLFIKLYFKRRNFIYYAINYLLILSNFIQNLFENIM